MSSINTNNGAMIALQTLQSVNKNLGDVQGQISTGLKVGSAKDNSAVFAISQVMKSDVSGFKAVSDSLSLGSSTLSVASAATSSIGDTLNEIKGKIVAAQESNVDRGKLQDEISSLVKQVTSVTDAAQFNGLNLLDGSAGAQLDILSSLDRDSDGNVSATKINVDLSATNLSTTAGVGAGTSFGATTGGINTAGDKFATTADATTGTATVELDDLDAGEVLSITVGENTYEYTGAAADDHEAAAYAIRDQINAANKDGTDGISATADADGILTITNGTSGSIGISGEANTSATGGLADLATINIDGTDQQRSDALTNIETMIDTVINAQATFGTAEKRIEMQGEFMSKLTDSFTSGIGSLVDADMEAASARLQALQVQQQLGTQALSIANQAPQQLLSLFR